jgi:hypothetical protein
MVIAGVFASFREARRASESRHSARLCRHGRLRETRPGDRRRRGRGCANQTEEPDEALVPYLYATVCGWIGNEGHRRQRQPRQSPLRLNDELTVALLDRKLAGRPEEILRDEDRYARRVDAAKWAARGLGDRLLELLAMPFALVF